MPSDSDLPERRRPLLLFLFFFCVVAGFWALKPLRTSTVVKAFGADYYPLVKQSLIVAAPLFLALYTSLARRLTRPMLVQFFCGLFLAAGLAFWVAFTWFPSAWAKVAFYFFVDAYGAVMVTLFWTYANDVSCTARARASYGFIGAGGIAGGLLGSMVSGWLSGALGSHIILFVPLLIACISLLVILLERHEASPAPETAAPVPAVPRGRSLLESWRATRRSRSLLRVLVIVCCYEVVSTIVDFQFAAASSAAFTSRDAMAGFQGKVFFLAQAAALVVQLTVTPLVHRRLGAFAGLLFLPAVLLTGSVAFLFVPVLSVITVAVTGENLLAYSVHQSSKEMLYVPLARESKLQGKAFIDIFAVRAAKSAGAAILLLYTLWLSRIGVPPTFLVAVNLLVIALWLLALRRPSRRANPLASAEAAPAASAPAAAMSGRAVFG